jgi:hypothetical protein
MDNNKIECGEIRALIDCRWECEMIQLLWKMFWHFLKRLALHMT